MYVSCLVSGSVDGLRRRTKLEVRHGFQSLRTIPEVNMISLFGAGHDPGEGAYFVRVEADQRSICQVLHNQWYQITAVIVLLTFNWPRR